MEEINLEHSSIDENYLFKLYEQEKIERLTNNKKKCLETTIKIVKNFLSKVKKKFLIIKNILKINLFYH
jgi:hypothetical protein